MSEIRSPTLLPSSESEEESSEELLSLLEGVLEIGALQSICTSHTVLTVTSHAVVNEKQ